MRRLILMVLVLAVAPVLGTAQTVKTSWANLQQLSPGSKIEIQAVGKDIPIRAKLVAVSQDALACRRGKTEVSLERRNIRRVLLLNESKRKRNRVLGAFIGAGALLVPSYVIGQLWAGEGNAVGGITTAGVGIGAGLGVLLTLRSGYQTVYEAGP